MLRASGAVTRPTTCDWLWRGEPLSPQRTQRRLMHYCNGRDQSGSMLCGALGPQRRLRPALCRLSRLLMRPSRSFLIAHGVAMRREQVMTRRTWRHVSPLLSPPLQRRAAKHLMWCRHSIRRGCQFIACTSIAERTGCPRRRVPPQRCRSSDSLRVCETWTNGSVSRQRRKTLRVQGA